MKRTTIRNAFSQAFFSIGTGIGSILAYSAYLNRKAPLPQEAVAVVGLDTAVGLLASTSILQKKPITFLREQTVE